MMEVAQNEDLTYMQNKAKFASLSRTELASKSRTIRMYTFSDYTPKKKVSVFKEKLQKLINQNIFSAEKNSVIKYALDNLNPSFYQNSTFANLFLNNLYKLCEKAKFTDEEIATIFYSFDDVIIKNGKVNNYNNVVQTDLVTGARADTGLSLDDGPVSGGGEKAACNMSWCLTCGLQGGGYNCESDCEAKRNTGCGWFLQQPCEKICR